MIRYTTAVIPILVRADLTGFQIYVSLEGKSNEPLTIRIPDEDITIDTDEGTTSFSISLGQEDTARFFPLGSVKIQLNAINEDGDRCASNGEDYIKVTDNLLQEVIVYETP